MSMLNGFPMVDQNTNITSDGRPSENAVFDCVAASICAMCMYLNGVKQMDHDKYNVDKFKDAAYGEALHNSGTAAIKYVDYCKSLGIKLYSIDGDYHSLIQQAHAFLAKGLPVMFTQDDWIVDTSLPQYQGWSHVAVWYADSPGVLTSMDPWGGFPRAKSDATWANLMRFNQIWVAERISTMTTPTGWKDDGTTLTAPNGVSVVHGFRLHVLNNNWHPANWPLAAEFGSDRLEDSNPALGGGTQQMFRWSMLGYTKDRGVFEEWLGVELQLARSQVAKYYAAATQAQAQVAQLQAQLAQLQQTNPDALAAIHQAQAILAPFK